MNTTEVKFGEWINRGWAIYKANWLSLISTVAVMAVCVVVPGMIIAKMSLFHPVLAMILNVAIMALVGGPLAVGFARVLLQLQAAPMAKLEVGAAIGTVFQGYQQFKDAALLFLVVSGASVLVQIISGLILPQFLVSLLGLAVSLAVSAAFMFSAWILADRKCDFTTALRGSWAVVKTNFWSFLGFNVMAGVLSAVGFIACFVGIIATLPLYFCLLAVAYRDVFTSATEAQAQPPAL